MGECIDRRIPWMVWDAIDELRKVVKPGMRVFEWGIGGSTLFWLDKGCSVVSVDHSSAWFTKVLEIVGNEPRAKLMCIPPEHGPGCDTQFRSEVIRNYSFREYAKAINGAFDIVCVDGRARPSCLNLAPSHVASGGMIILDNSERARYKPAIRALESIGWRHKQVFSGHGPESGGVKWETTFFRRK